MNNVLLDLNKSDGRTERNDLCILLVRKARCSSQTE